MSIHVFVGPTISISEATSILDAIFHPPAKAGDVCALLEERPSVIGIIDGYFDQVPSVWHKEILRALADGVRVFGSSSMGALRAAELSVYGMIGIGRIFEAFLSGQYEDDDEVAVSHASAEMGYQPLSDAMVNLREGLRRAKEEGYIGQGSHDRLVEAAKCQFYPDRSWRGLFHLGRGLSVPQEELDALMTFVREERPDLKKDDAALLLRRIAKDQASGITPHVPNFAFEATLFWRMLQVSVRKAKDTSAG